MTLNEAIGVVNCDIDKATGKRLNHQEKYRRMIMYLGGLSAVSHYIPFSIEEIRKALPKDKTLNNLSMKKWDLAAGFISSEGDYHATFDSIWRLYRLNGITSASCAEGVCILKEAARWMVERCAT